MIVSRSGCILGIDPGLKGGLAVYDPEKQELVAAWAMPIITIQDGRSKKSNIDLKRVRMDVSDACVEYGVVLAVIEKVQSSPQMGVASAFKFGDGFGIVRAYVEAMAPVTEYVSPQRWKARMLLGSDKAMSVQRGIEHFGNKFNMKKDGIAEAALLAKYGAMTFLNCVDEVDPLS